MQFFIKQMKDAETEGKARALASNRSKEMVGAFLKKPHMRETFEKLSGALQSKKELEFEKDFKACKADMDDWGNEKITYSNGTEIAAGVTVTEKYLYFIHLLAMETISKYAEQDAAQSSTDESS